MQSENSYSSQTPQSLLAFKLLHLWVNFFRGASFPLAIMVMFNGGKNKRCGFQLKEGGVAVCPWDISSDILGCYSLEGSCLLLASSK